jgi:AbrB family looped-hinge helix DNA binding protein
MKLKEGMWMTEIKKGKYFFGTVKIGERGQIVIPKEAREVFEIKPGDNLLLVGDVEKGIAIVKADLMKDLAIKILDNMNNVQDIIKSEKGRGSALEFNK